MKLFLVLLLCVSAYSFPQQYVFSPVDDLIHEALEYIRTLLKKHEPFPVPDMPDQTVKGDDIDFTVQFNNLYVSKASDFNIDYVENDIFHLKGKFGVTVPKLHLEGGYDVQGAINGKQVSGSGNFKLDIAGLVTKGEVKGALVDHSIQMTDLKIDYDIDSVEFSEDGLSVEGLTKEEIKELFDKSLLDYFQNNKAFVASQVSNYVKQCANDIMEGKSLQQLIDWLKKFIHG